MRFGLISSGLADPRSESGAHQLGAQSLGWKEVGDVSVGLNLITESLNPSQGIALPTEMKTLLEVSSTTTPPAAQTPAPPDDGV